MDNVIPFPLPGNSKELKSALARIRGLYLQAGLTEASADAALAEFRPILEQFMVRKAFVFEYKGPVSFTPQQWAVVKAANTQGVRDASEHFKDQLGLALNIIAGLIGRQHR